MFESVKSRISHGFPYIPNIRKAGVDEKFRGLPSLKKNVCKDCSSCVEVCPTGAISLKSFRIDIGKCIFCGDCERECSKGAVNFTPFHKTAASSREALIVSEGDSSADFEKKAIQIDEKIRSIFGRSLKLRQVSAGGCSACEMELGACSNVNFDMGRFGIEFTASPRHADGIVITGPVTFNMAEALEDALSAVPEPKLIIAVGSCAISGGIFQDSPAMKRDFFEKHKVDLYVPGCPIHPLTFINGLLDFTRGKRD